MSCNFSLSRGLAVAVALCAGQAFAQAPVNDACAGAEPLTVSASGAVASSGVTANIDQAAAGIESPMGCGGSNQTRSVWYSFTAPATGLYRVATCGAVNFDTVMQVYSGGCGALTSLGGSGCNDEGCGTSGPSGLSALSLTGGTTYFVQVAAYSAATTNARVGLSVNLLMQPVNDSCSAPTPLGLNAPVSFSTNALTLNDSTLGGNLDGGAGTCFTGLGHSTTAASNASPGRDVVFSFRPSATGAYNVRLGFPNASVNSTLYLTDSCVPPMTPPLVYAPPQCIAASNRGGSSASAAEELVCVSLTGGAAYYIWVDETSLSSGGASYEVEVTSCTPESEPNDSVATAGALSCPVTGRVATNGEVDFYAAGTPPAGSRVFALVEAAAAGSGGFSSTDFDLRVTSATDTLEFDNADADTAFGGSSAAIAGTPLTGTPTYLRVNYRSATTSREPYRLYSTVQTGAALAEAEPNDTVAASNAGTANYFRGDVSSPTDVDVFAFEARAGDLLFLALDAEPTRAATTPTGNLNLQLLNQVGAVLVSADDSNTTVNTTVVTGSLTAETPAVPSETLVYRVRTTGMFFARVGRSSATGSGAYLLSISRDCAPGGGIGPPTLTSLNPATGSVSGNTTVTLSGTNFSNLSTVRFGSTTAQIVNRSSTSLEVLTPAGSDGAVDVSVTNPGPQTVTLTGGYLYFTPLAPPTIASVTPASGPTAGGTAITVTGSLFKAGAEVTLSVGGVPQRATNVVVINSARLTATTPSHVAGLASLTVRNPADALEGSRADTFTYLAPPVATSITPSAGLTSGGQSITIQGAAFRAGAVVRFGANAGTNVVVDPGGTSLTVTTPAALVSGVVNVTVVNADAQQTVLTGGFTYSYPAPSISSITPASGFATGGTPLTITGNGIQAAATVTVGGNLATGLTRISLTEIRAVTPAGAAGLADVTVTNVDNQAATRTGGFRYVPAPSITSITPSRGPMQGGVRVTLTGSNFQAGATLRLGGVPAFAVTVQSPTSLTAVANANGVGPADVVLTNPDTQAGTLAAGFTYDGAPSLSAISPTTGTTAGGTLITLTGTGFLNGATVLFGATAATGVTVDSPTRLTALSPAAPVSVVSVTVRNTDGQSALLQRVFRFVAPPTVTTIAPGTGDVSGGTLVRVTGAGFNASTTVSFGGIPAAQVSLVSATELDAVTPAHAPGVVPVKVSTDGAVANLADGFTFTRSAPTLVAVAPVSGPIAGGTSLTLSGTGFAPGATITVGGAAATAVVVVSNVLARAVIPAHAAGNVDVVFTNDDSQAATLAGGFTFVAPPDNNAGTVTDGGSGSIGEDPTSTPTPGGVSCGCTSVDGSMFSMAGFGLLMVLSRRRRRS